MLLPGTQMHIITFIFVCIELVIFFYLSIYKLARHDDKSTYLDIILIALLITYNVTGGLLPDINLPGSLFLQECIAYATGFITPCYFPYYVYKAFGLEKMKFHAFRGVYFFLIIPCFIFIILYGVSGDLNAAKDLFVIPVLYAIWILYSLGRSLKYKFKNDYSTYAAREEVIILFTSLAPWVGLPFIDYFNLGQAAEASITNTGFLLLLALHVKEHIKDLRTEHERLIESEQQLLNWNTRLKNEVKKRTEELEKVNEQRTNTFVNLAHETKTPLTLINNYLEEYMNSNGNSEELSVVKRNIDKLSTDITNFFDLEKFNKGFAIYNHEQVCNLSEILNDNLMLFNRYAKRKNIHLKEVIEDNIFIQADPVSINRIIINLIENAIKFSGDDCEIEVLLQADEETIKLSIKDCGVGIPPELHKKIFEPYYQIAKQKRSIQGMGLGLPIVKKVVQDLKGEIKVFSDPKREPGTTILVILKRHQIVQSDELSTIIVDKNRFKGFEEFHLEESPYDSKKPTVLLVEDNVSMVNYLLKKLQEKYNVYIGLNGNDALKKLKSFPTTPDLIISDIMMDKLDGFGFAKIISNDLLYNHIPFIFLSAKFARNDKLQGLKLGAIDIIQKPFSIAELIQKIDSILTTVGRQKQLVLTSAMNALSDNKSSHLQNLGNRFELNAEIYKLTSREKDIAKLICQGDKYKRIGEQLFISERTVTKHVQNIFEKLEVSNKIELMNKLER